MTPGMNGATHHGDVRTVQTLKTRIVASGTTKYHEELAPTTCIRATVLRKSAMESRQFETRKEAECGVREFFRSGARKQNVTSVIAEIIARQSYPGARTVGRRRSEDRTDFFVGERRFQVKSIVRGNTKFVLGPETVLSSAHGRCPADMFVFVRFWSFVCHDEYVDARCDTKTLSRRAMQLILARLERERGSLPKLGYKVKLTATQLGFEPLPRDLKQVWRRKAGDGH